jgi:hypothetical protein
MPVRGCAQVRQTTLAGATARALIAVSLVCIGTVAGADPISFGTRTLDLPAPEGFVAVSPKAPQYVKLAQAYLPAGNRLVEVYAEPETADRLASGTATSLLRYFQIQTLRSADGKILSSSEFAEGSHTIEAELIKAFGKLPDHSKELSQGNAAASREAGKTVDVRIGETNYLGTFKREPWAVFYSMRATVGAGDDTPVTILNSGAITLINHQFLFLYAYAQETGPESQRWTEAAVTQWADAIHASNPDTVGLEASAEHMSTGIDWGHAARTGLIWGALAGLFALVNELRKRMTKR